MANSDFIVREKAPIAKGEEKIYILGAAVMKICIMLNCGVDCRCFRKKMLCTNQAYSWLVRLFTVESINLGLTI